MARSKVLQVAGVEAADFSAPVTCPAGEPLSEVGGWPRCRCGITDTLVGAATDPSTFHQYCTGDGTKRRPGYTACEVWRAAREADWERRGLVA